MIGKREGGRKRERESIDLFFVLLRVMVLSAGEIIEFDSPNKLIEKGGVFHSLAKDAGLI